MNNVLKQETVETEGKSYSYSNELYSSAIQLMWSIWGKWLCISCNETLPPPIYFIEINNFWKVWQLNSEIYHHLSAILRAADYLPSTTLYILMPEGTSPLISFTLNLFNYRIAETLDLWKYLPNPLVWVRNMDLVMDRVWNASLKPHKPQKLLLT